MPGVTLRKCTIAARQWKCRKGCGICKTFRAEDEYTLWLQKRHLILIYICEGAIYGAQEVVWLLLLYVGSSYQENTEIILCVRWNK